LASLCLQTHRGRQTRTGRCLETTLRNKKALLNIQERHLMIPKASRLQQMLIAILQIVEELIICQIGRTGFRGGKQTLRHHLKPGNALDKAYRTICKKNIKTLGRIVGKIPRAKRTDTPVTG